MFHKPREIVAMTGSPWARRSMRGQGEQAAGTIGREAGCRVERPAEGGDPVDKEERPWGADTYRRELHQALQGDIDGLVEFVHAGVVVTDLPDGPSLRPVIRHAVTLMLRGLFGAADSLDASLWHRIGAGLALQEGPRPAVVGRFDTGTRLMWAYVLQRTATMSAPPSVAGNVLLDMWNRLEAVREPALAQLLAGYDERRERETNGGTNPPEALVDSILDSDYDDPDGLQLTAKRMGVDLTVTHGLFVVTVAPGREADLTVAASALEKAVKGCLFGSPRSRPRPHRPALVACPSTAAWAAKLRRANPLVDRFGVTLLTADPVAPIGPDRAVESHYRLLLRGAIVTAAVSSRPAVLDVADIEYHWLMTRASVEERADFVRATLESVLVAPKGDELLDLLDALYETRGGYAGAALLLGIHRNTVDGRRKKLTEATGLSLDVPADAHRLFTASRLLKLLDRATLGLPRS